MEKADDKVKEAAKHKGDYANGADKAPCAHIVINLALFSLASMLAIIAPPVAIPT